MAVMVRHRSSSILPIVFVLLILSLPSCGQVDAVSPKENLYAVALEASIFQMEKDWSHLDDSFDNRQRTDYRRMIVEKDPVLTDNLPTGFQDHSVEYLDDHELVTRYKKLRKRFAILRIFPMQNDGTRLRIHVSLRWFSHRNGRTMREIDSWSDVWFKYDCQRERFVVDSVKLGGI